MLYTAKKDQASTIKNISTDQIEKLAVEDLASAIVGMQAGVVQRSFWRRDRDNRSDLSRRWNTEWMRVFGGSSSMLSIEPGCDPRDPWRSNHRNLQCRAYGQRNERCCERSQLKDGSNKLSGSPFLLQALQNILLATQVYFMGHDKFTFNRNQDYKFQLEWADPYETRCSFSLTFAIKTIAII